MFYKTIFAKYIFDLSLWTLAGIGAFVLRLEGQWPTNAETLSYLGISLIIKIVIEWYWGFARQSWRKIGILDLYSLIKGVGFATLVMLGIGFLLSPSLHIPRSIPLIEGVLGLLFLGGVRLLIRLLNEREAVQQRETNKRVLIVGAGDAGVMMARELMRHPAAGLSPIGFLDDDINKKRRYFVGLPVFGKLDDLLAVVENSVIDEVLIAIPSMSGEAIRKVVELARQAKISYKIIPGIHEILSGKVSISQIRDVSLEDLLRREPVELNTEEISYYLEDKIILVTGAGGSIGSEIIRQVARFKPKRVVLLGRGENSVYIIQQEMHRTWPELEQIPIIADARNFEKLENVFKTYQPQVVFHAAAHKHVPLMEQHPDEAIFNNIRAVENIAKLSLKYEVERLVNISTDKAVNPTSVMGTSKRIAEFIVADAARRAKDNQKFVSVRFGNVLGSRGSVIPLFKAQIEAGGPVTVTHPDMIRYFMLIPEASRLVLQAGGMGQNGEVYVLDMGKPVKIVDLARDLIRLSGFEPNKDIDIVFSGSRPGEKLFEELLTSEEGTVASKYEKIFIAIINVPDSKELEQSLKDLYTVAASYDIDKIKQAMKEIVPQYVEPKGL